MKKLFFMTILLALTMVFPACSGQRRAVQANALQQEKPTLDDELERAKKRAELEEIQHQQKLAQMKREAELRRLESQLQATEKMEQGSEAILVFCIDDAVDKQGEYMAGLGISSNQLDQRDALVSANQSAIADIALRFMGVIKNGVEAYNKETNTQQRMKQKESQLEGLATAVGEKVINKYANVVCRKVVSEKTGTYGAYVAVHVPLKDVVDDIANELDVLQADYDKSRFRERMQAELDAEQEKRKAAQEQMLQNMRQ